MKDVDRIPDVDTFEELCRLEAGLIELAKCDPARAQEPRKTVLR